MHTRKLPPPKSRRASEVGYGSSKACPGYLRSVHFWPLSHSSDTPSDWMPRLSSPLKTTLHSLSLRKLRQPISWPHWVTRPFALTLTMNSGGNPFSASFTTRQAPATPGRRPAPESWSSSDGALGGGLGESFGDVSIESFTDVVAGDFAFFEGSRSCTSRPHYAALL